MTPTVLFILWACHVEQPVCPIYAGINNYVRVYPAADAAECAAHWKSALEEPDPPGYKFHYQCQAISEPL